MTESPHAQATYTEFTELVAAATASQDHPKGFMPYDYQVRIAEDGFPDLIEVPTGAGKTQAAVLSWVWRRLFHPEESVRAQTPRRLVLALPTRALIEQTGKSVAKWVGNLDLSEAIDIHVMMGGGRWTRRHAQDWRIALHRPAVIIGTLDQILSRLLLRGFGVYRGSYPIDFALLGNGCQIVVDEIQLVPQATATLRQLAAFQRSSGTAEPSGLTVMSATVDERILRTVDNPFPGDSGRVIKLKEKDHAGALAVRLKGVRAIRRLTESPPTPGELAVAILDQHQTGRLTMVVRNTVDAAVETYAALRHAKPAAELLLIHSRFRGVERETHMETLDAMKERGGIVVTTQAIEAGVDIDACTLFTEAAPWSSIVQRAGRCNRAGKCMPGEATLNWFVGKLTGDKPYMRADIEAAEAALISLEGREVTFEDLNQAGADLPKPDLQLKILRRNDFHRLFDTTPDLSGHDLDISGYIRADMDLDLQLAWVPPSWFTEGRQVLPSTVPAEALRCPVSVAKAKEFVSQDGVTAWVFDPSEDAWVKAARRRLRPQDTVIVSAASGGYDPVLGFAPKSTAPVDPDPRSNSELRPRNKNPESNSASEEPGANTPLRDWVTLEQHLADTERHARRLIEVLQPPGLSTAHRRTVYAAAALHDLGKAHKDWQQALREAHPTDPPPADTAYAKSPGSGVLRIKRTPEEGKPPVPRTGFRHELVALFMLSTPEARDLLGALEVPDHSLARYLVAAHHGHIRMTARDPQWDGRDGTTLFGCSDTENVPGCSVKGHQLPPTRVDLRIFKAGRHDSWQDHTGALLDEFGPFRLGYLETVVRMADWRASAGLPEAGAER